MNIKMHMENNMYTIKRCLLILTITIRFLTCCKGSIGRGAISIEDNGYNNILISVAARVPPNPKLIDRIKAAYTETSASLYQATR